MGAAEHRRARSTLVAGLAVISVALTGCANDAAPAATPVDETVAETTEAPTAEAAPATPSAPAAVVGERVPAAHWVSSASLLSHRATAAGSGDAVLPLVHEVGDWLDAHLTDLQAGGDGRLADVADPGLLDAAAAADLDAVTVALASADAPAASARYVLEGSYDAMAEWVEATVEVTRPDGTVARATMVFTPGDAGPRLVLFGPATAGGRS